MSSNVLTISDDYGEYDDWIELYNPTGQAIDIAGYSISDDAGIPDKWRIPQGYPEYTVIGAGDYLLLWADDQPLQGPIHLPFKLGKSEQVILSAADGSLADSITYPGQESDISYGRYPDGAMNRGYSDHPTPAGANREVYTTLLSAPGISVPSGVYEQPFSVTLWGGAPGDCIYYSLDGSDPDADADRFDGAVPIDRNTVVKARIINSDARSRTAAAVFFLKPAHTLPILSIAVDPDHLFSDSIGIYANPLESGREWERRILLSYVKDEDLRFSENAGLRIQGNTGREMQKKSFRLYFRDGYGPPELNYPFFDHSPVTLFENLVLKSGYDDDLIQPGGTLLRDPLISELWRRTGNVASQGVFSVLYLNNDFWGIYQIREDINDHFIRDYLGYDEFDIIRLRWNAWEVDYGSSAEWEDFLDFLYRNDFSSDSLYAEAIKRIDIENFTTVQAFYHLSQFFSWVYGAFFIREKTAGAPWKIAVWDADRALNDVTWNGFTYYNNLTEPYWINIIAQKLLQNAQYREYFCNRLCDYINTLFLPQRVNGIIDSLRMLIEPEIERETGRWAGDPEDWQSRVDGLKQFVEGRPNRVLSQMAAWFHFSYPADITVDVGEGRGSVTVNRITPDQYPWSGRYFREIPVTLTAHPAEGFRFAGWSGYALPQQPVIRIYPSHGDTITARFVDEGTATIRVITPDRTAPGRLFPLVVRMTDPDGKTDPRFSGPVFITSASGGIPDTIMVKKGAGTFVETVTETSGFTLSLSHEQLGSYTRPVAVYQDYPSEIYSGTLPQGSIVWDGAKDRVITGDLTVPEGCHLTITEGTQVLLDEDVNVFVNGTLTISGSETRPVVFLSSENAAWGGIVLNHTQAEFSYVFFVNGGGDLSRPWQHSSVQPVLFALNDTEMTLSDCSILNSPGKAIGSDHSRVTVTNCITAFVYHGGEYHYTVLNYRDSHIMNIPTDDHIFEDGDSDAFHIDYIYPGFNDYSVIADCYFITGKDDAVDHHGARLLVKDCYIEDWMHEGVAASGGDTIKVFNTVVRNCEQGIEAGWTDSDVEHGPHVLVDHCVVLDSDVGLRFGDSYDWTYLGHMAVTNTILYNNADNIRNYLNSTLAPKEGAIDISYSMTNDTDYDAAPFCIKGTPQFDENYFLAAGSPGSGEGQYGTNMGRIDSSALDLGAVMVTEIMYKNSDALASSDWIELYNPQPYPQNISGWMLQDNRDDHRFIFPVGTVISAGGFLVVCRDTAAFKAVYPSVKTYLGNVDFGLGEEDEVRIHSSNLENVDSVSYSNIAPWPAEADGTGRSLTLKNIHLNNALPESWIASSHVGGSPGYFNDEDTQRVDPGPSVPDRIILYQNYPNPFNSATTIRYTIASPYMVTSRCAVGTWRAVRLPVELSIYDILGRKITTLVSERQPAGTYQVRWDAQVFSSGVYFCLLTIDGRHAQTRKLVLLR